METEVLHLLGFNVQCATPVAFIGACLKSLAEVGSDMDYAHAFEMASYHTDLFLVQGESVRFAAALVGAAAVISALFTLGFHTKLRPVAFLCRVPEHRIRPLVCRMQHLHAQDSAGGSRYAVYDRYSGELVPSKPASVAPRAPMVTQCEGVGVCWWCETPKCATRHGGAAPVEVVLP
ncbi:hypothetical protein T484DRAFT_1893693 [Baffinella frigidus]|nr:hypothetical protein T484DRAFT_1893693 [Cryptophyta sp. CCMP2293]